MTEKTDLLAHNTDRSAQMREEYREHVRKRTEEEAQREFDAALRREESIKEDERRVRDIIPPGMTRDQLLERIVEMRNVKVEEVEPVYYVHPDRQAQIDLEQAEGRRLVALAEAERKRMFDAMMQVEAAEKGVMVPVHHPNPAQDEQYPAVKATLGKPHDRPKQLK